MRLRAFQHRFLKGAMAPGIRTAALSLPRGNGKSTLISWLAARALTPGDRFFHSGSESHIVAASLGQARRTVFKILRGMLPDDGSYRISDSENQAHIVHLDTGTKISVLAANFKTAQGLVDVPWVLADEPGSWECNGGQAMHSAIQTAMGKPGSNLRALYAGTLAPAVSGWWHSLIEEGTEGSQYVQSLVGDRGRWDQLRELRRCNPLMYAFESSRAVLKDELRKALSDDRLRAQFLSYRLNLPTADASVMLLAIEDWLRMLERPVPAREGRPAVGVDLGAGRGWSAAVATWPNGRVEARALTPGIPSLEAQERRDKVPSGTYAALVRQGILQVAHGLRVQPTAQLMETIKAWVRQANWPRSGGGSPLVAKVITRPCHSPSRAVVPVRGRAKRRQGCMWVGLLSDEIVVIRSAETVYAVEQNRTALVKA